LFFALGGRNPIEAVPGFELLADGDSPRLGARIQEELLDSSTWLRTIALDWAQGIQEESLDSSA